MRLKIYGITTSGYCISGYCVVVASCEKQAKLIFENKYNNSISDKIESIKEINLHDSRIVYYDDGDR